MVCVVSSIRVPPKVKISRAGLSLVKHGSRWFVVPTTTPESRQGEGFSTKAEAQKIALSIATDIKKAEKIAIKPDFPLVFILCLWHKIREARE